MRSPDDLQREIESHIALEADRLVAQGMPRSEAEHAAHRTFGNLTRTRENFYESTRRVWLDQTWQDLRYASRVLRQSPLLVAVSVLSLSLGIGANTALFSAAYHLLVESLPYRDAGKLVYITEFWPHEPVVPGPPSPDFANWRDHSQLVEAIAAYGGGADALTLIAQGEPRRIQATMVTAGLLDMLGTRLALGHNFTAEEDRQGAAPTVILGYALWQREFAASSNVVGKSILLNGASRVIVGVLPSSFAFPDNNFRHELLVPMALPSDLRWTNARDFRLLRVLARLRPGVSPEALRQEMAALVRANASQEPPQMVTMRRDLEIRVIPLREWLTVPVRRTLLMLEATVALLLLIACLNIASLQLARTTTRQRELAMRAAIGAARGRLIRQLLTESLLLATAGGCAGLGLAYAAVPLLKTLLPPNLHLASSIEISGGVLAFTILLTLASGIITGIAPAIFASRANPLQPLKARPLRVESVLIVAEVAFATVLLVGGALFMRTFLKLATADSGFRPEGVLTLRVSLPPRYMGPDAWLPFFQQLLVRARAIPGVEAASIAGGLPLIGTRSSGGMRIEGDPEAPPGGRPAIPIMGATTDYFRALSIPILRGRAFTPADETGPNVAIVNQAFAEKYFPGRDPLGRRLEVGSRDGYWREIVGIAGNVRQQGRRAIDSLVIYSPLRQMPEPEALLVLKSSIPPTELTLAAIDAVHQGDRNLPAFDIATMEERLGVALSTERANMILMSLFAALGLTLAAAGIYGVISFFVSRRLREIGIRQALGATERQIASLVLRRGLTLTIAGVMFGLAMAAALARAIASSFEGIQAADALAYGTAALVLLTASLAACLLPARSALRINPATILRRD